VRLLLHQAAFQALDRWRCETAQEKQRQLKSLRVIQKMLHRAAGAFGQWAVTARKPEERKQVVMQKVMKRLQHRGLALFALCVSSLLSTAHGAECHWDGSLPCSFGGCEFSKDAIGILDRTGSCPSQGGSLWLSTKGIKGLREGVFSNLSACVQLALSSNELTALPETVLSGLTNLKILGVSYNQLTALPETVFKGLTNLQIIFLEYNQLASLPETVFNGLTNLESVYLHYNKLTRLPATVFNGLTNLQNLFLNSNALTSLPAPVFNGLTNLRQLGLHYNPDLSCVPLTQGRIEAISHYQGTRVTCQHLNCTAGNAGPVGGTCTPCGVGKFSPISWATACTDCGPGKYSTGTGASSESTCAPCGAGKYSSTSGASTCVNCGAGTYSEVVGSTSWSTCSGTPCSAGKYGQIGATSASAAACSLCLAGTYVDRMGASGCKLCPAGKTSAAGSHMCVDDENEDDEYEETVVTTPPDIEDALMEAAQKYPKCTCTRSWEEIVQEIVPSGTSIFQSEPRMRTGGLGKFMLKGKYEVWVCLQDNTCSTLEDWFCYVFNEQTFIFEAWGFNSELKVVKSK
jgi:hypothetical protein